MSLTKIEKADIGASNLYFRNLIINGDMNVHQRGTSVSGITSDGYRTADRWFFLVSNIGTWTNTVENDAPSGTGLRKSFKVTCTAANASPSANAYLGIVQRLEGQNLQILKKGTSSAESITFSFWVKSNVTGTYTFDLLDWDNTRQISRTYNISSINVWEKKVITIPGDSIGSLDNDNSNSFEFNFWLDAGSDYTSGTLNTSWSSRVSANTVLNTQVKLASTLNNYFQVTGVQMEVGAVATPFEVVPYEIQLMRCQRYYVSYVIPQDYSDGYNNTILYRNYFLPVEMRVQPSSFTILTQFQYYSGGNAANVTPTFGGVSGSRQSFIIFTTGLTSGRGLLSGRVGINVEL